MFPCSAPRSAWFRCVGALALVAWLGLVTMGMARAMPEVDAAGVSAASVTMAMSAHAPSGHAHHGDACGSPSGCHCGGLCYVGAAPSANGLNPMPAHGQGYARLAPGVPARLHPPLLHPPSV